MSAVRNPDCAVPPPRVQSNGGLTPTASALCPTFRLPRQEPSTIQPFRANTPVSTAALFGMVAEVMTSSRSLEDMLGAALRLVQNLMQVDRCSILLLRERSDEMYMAASGGIPEAVREQVRVPRGAGLAGKALDSLQPILGSRDPEPEDERFTTSSYIVCPIVLRGEPLGVLNVTNRYNREPFSQEDLDQLQGVAGFIAVAIENAKLAATLERQRQQLEGMLEHLPLGVLQLDARDTVTGANKRAAEMLGVDGRIPEDTPLLEAVPNESAGTLRGVASRSRIRKQPTFQELATTSIPPGEFDAPTPLRVSAYPTPETGDVFLLLEDLSLSHENEALRRIDEMKTNFIALVSHELRTPITSLRGAATLLTSFYGQGLDETQQNLMRIVSSNADRLSALVNTIIDVALVEQQQMHIALKPGNLEKLVEELVAARDADLRLRQLSVLRDYREIAPAVRFDAERLGQAIGAVLDNAIKFARPNSEVVINLRPRADGGALLRVRNEGERISEEYRERVFEKFFQVEHTMTRRQGGTGLGLYLARQIVQLHGGTLTIADDDDGTALEFLLPANRD